MSDKHDVSGVQTTGHVWDDDLGDFTNQPPKWWMLGLAASALWVVVYFIYYPSIPIAISDTYTKGVGGWTAINEMEAAKGDVDAIRSKYEAKIKDLTPAQILADNELSEYVKRSGKVLFGDYCAACHGQNGIGTKDKLGYMAPILNDDDWLYGGKVENIHETISAGRMSMMPGHKDTLTAAEIDALAQAIEKGQPTSTPLFAEKGCSACHGEDGKGNPAMGAANLTDKIARFDGSVEGLKYTIAHGVNNSADPQTRGAEMPAFSNTKRLSETDIKKLAVYVHKFGGGQAAEAAPAPVATEVAAAPADATAASAPADTAAASAAPAAH